VDGVDDCVPKACYIDVPLHLQEMDTWCGPAVVQMISGYYGISRIQANLAASMKTGNVTNVGMLWKLFADFGFKVNGSQEGQADRRLVELERTVCEEKVPVVVLQRLSVNDTKYGHYRIVVGFDAGRVFVLDPIIGLSAYGREDFTALWRKNRDVETGNVALVPTPE
jgi:ABC-type bacteriocin/lantibiotic exporter with double-glycine peptidase domain